MAPNVRRLIVIILNLILLPGYFFGQNYSEENISLAAGLSQSSVFSLSQDGEGFLWAGTQDGLNKYDGLNFKTYYNLPFASTSLSSGHIISMLHDRQGNFWVGTQNHGLNLMIPGTEKFRVFMHSDKDKTSILNNTIHVIHEGPGGTIWLGTGNGLQRVIVSRQKDRPTIVEFETVFRDTSSSGLFAITAIYENKNGDVWIGTLRGLLKLSFRGKDNFLPVGGNVYTESDGLNSNQVMAFQADQYGNYWIGTNKGVCVMNSQTGKILNVPLRNKGFVSSMTEVNNFCLSSDGTLWIASGQGLYNLKTDEIRNSFNTLPLPHLIETKTRKYTGGVLSIKEDHISKGIMWIGTGASGIIKLISTRDKNFYTNHLEEVLPSAFVFSIAKDKDGIIWAGTTDGLVRFDREKNDYKLFRHNEKDKKTIASDYVTKIRIDKYDQLWVGTQKGLQKVSKRNSAKPIFELVVINPQFPDVNIRDISFDENGDMIVVLPGRVYHYSIKEKQSTVLAQAKMEGKRLPYGFMFMSALVDRNKNLWIGSSIGLFLYQRQAAGNPYDFEHPQVYLHNPHDTASLRSHTINNIYEDSSGLIWICTPNGLTRAEWINSALRFTNYSTDDGLKNNAVYGILENPLNGNLWMSTNGGLSRLDPHTMKFSNYDIHDGLQSNEFNGGAYSRAEDNEFLFGGIDGFTTFYPNEIREDTVAPRVLITSFALAGDNISNPELPETKKIELNYNQNSFSIGFIALQYSNPGQNKYAYKLDGFQKEWTQNGHNHQVNFSQLPPGQYIFHVIGSNADGIFSRNADTISILIHPPFWKTIWFYLLLAVGVAVIAWLLHAYLLGIKLRQVQEIESIRKETAADFHDELGHKLSTISWFGEILKKKINPEQKELRMHLDRIIDTAGSLYHTMKDMVWAMDPGQDSMKDLYKQITEFGESLFDQTGVEFSATELNGEFKGVTIPLTQKRHVLLIFKEAMHNSFRHSHGDKVRLDLLRENNHVTIKLEDNGKGFQLDWEQTGNGLRNVRKRTEVIGGKLKIESGNQGTILELEVPLKS